MSQLSQQTSPVKRVRSSRFAAYDEAFVYDPSTKYNVNDFENLTLPKIYSVATTLQVRNIKRYKKEQLISVVIEKHEESQKLRNEFPEQLKMKFVDIYNFFFYNEVWFEGSAVASFLEYQENDVHTYVRIEDQMLYDETPDTIFINQYGILDLVSESKMPLSRQFRKWFIFDMLPSILDTRCHTNEIPYKVPYLRINNQIYYCAKL